MTLLFQDTDGPWVSRNRRILIGLFFAVLVLQPFQIVLHGPHSDLEWFQLTGAVVVGSAAVAGRRARSDSRVPPA